MMNAKLERIVRAFKDAFPLLGAWMIEYDWRSSLLSDVIAGSTLYSVFIPQALSYSVLAGLPPIYGLYSSTFTLFIYAFLGSSRHLSFGPFAITSQVLGMIALKFPSFERGTQAYVDFIMFTSLMAAIFTIFMVVFGLGKLTRYIPNTVLSAFITGCACIIVLHQVEAVLGLPKPPPVVYTYDSIVYIFSHLDAIQAVDVAFSLPSIPFTISSFCWKRKHARKPPPQPTTAGFKMKSAIANTSFFLVFVVGISVSYSLLQEPDAASKYSFRTVGYIVPGIRAPSPPNVPLTTQEIAKLLPQSFILAVLAYISNWSMTKTFAMRFKYMVNSSQELWAMGITNIIGSLLFNSFFSAGGMARSAVNVESGAKSQLSSVVVGILNIVSLLYFTQVLAFIPYSILGSVIIGGVYSMIDFSKMRAVYKVDKKEAAVMVTTFLFTFFIGATEGFVLGIITSFLSALYSSAFPRIMRLGVVVRKDIKSEEEEQCGIGAIGALSQLLTRPKKQMSPFTEIDLQSSGRRKSSSYAAGIDDGLIVVEGGSNAPWQSIKAMPGILLLEIPGVSQSALYFANVPNLKDTIENLRKVQTVKAYELLVFVCNSFTEMDLTSREVLSEMCLEYAAQNLITMFVLSNASLKCGLRQLLAKSTYVFNMGPSQVLHRSIEEAIFSYSVQKQIRIMSRLIKVPALPPETPFSRPASSLAANAPLTSPHQQAAADASIANPLRSL